MSIASAAWVFIFPRGLCMGVFSTLKERYDPLPHYRWHEGLAVNKVFLAAYCQSQGVRYRKIYGKRREKK
jgi:hypothetical protein